MHALLIPVTGPCRLIAARAAMKGLTLDQLQEAVGGNIEAISISNSTSPRQTKELACLYVNEDGIGLGLEKNDRATALAQEYFPATGMMPGDYIKGDAILVGPVDDDGDSTDLADAILVMLAEACRSHQSHR